MNRVRRLAMYGAVVAGSVFPALGATPSATGSTPPAPVDCYVECIGIPAEACSPVSRTSTLTSNRLGWKVSPCASAMIKSGKARGLVMTPKGLQSFPVKQPDRSFESLHPQLFAAGGRCLGLSPECLESIDRVRLGAVAGKGFDGTKARRVGDPCAAGLPCGVILMPSAVAVIEVSSGDAKSRLILRAVRGASGSFELLADGGVFKLDPTPLKAGAAYEYTLKGSSGEEIAAGSFEIMSSKMQADVQADIQAARASPDQGEFGVLEVLLDNSLNWDAARLMR